MIKMKALRSFGVPGANEGKVKRGRELTAATEARARDLELAGLAYRVDMKLTEPPVVNQIVPTANEAANSGPLGSHGGTTGADAPVPSSPADHQPRRRRSPRSKSDEDLLS